MDVVGFGMLVERSVPFEDGTGAPRMLILADWPWPWPRVPDPHPQYLSDPPANTHTNHLHLHQKVFGTLRIFIHRY